MGARVAVAGGSGYAGGELLRLLSAHPDLEIGPLAAGTHAGAAVTDVHPNLVDLAGRTFDHTDPAALAEADLVFLALPHAEAAELAAQLPERTAVVDLGAGFRLADPQAWQRFYSGPHPGRWTYGLPELPGARQRIRGSRRVAVPGCYATAAILALVPLVAAYLVAPTDIVVVAASGTSGAGRSARTDLLGSEVMGSMAAYAAGGRHRHTPEIEQALGEALPTADQPRGVTMSFTPSLAPMPRGILATCTARLAAPPAGDGDAEWDARLRSALRSTYTDEPFVHLLPEGRWPNTGATAGGNAAHLQVAADTHAGRAVVVSAIDNLGKGAAGQAVQVANLVLGLPETAGLSAHGIAP